MRRRVNAPATTNGIPSVPPRQVCIGTTSFPRELAEASIQIEGWKRVTSCPNKIECLIRKLETAKNHKCSLQLCIGCSRRCCGGEIVMTNKAPIVNELTQTIRVEVLIAHFCFFRFLGFPLTVGDLEPVGRGAPLDDDSSSVCCCCIKILEI